MPHKDPEARRKYMANYNRSRYHDDPDFKKTHIKRVREMDKRRIERHENLIAAWRASGCILCPEKTHACLIAHHLDPEKKDFNVGDMRRRKLKLETLKKELAKCVCLCMNCHAKVHAELVFIVNAGIPG